MRARKHNKGRKKLQKKGFRRANGPTPRWKVLAKKVALQDGGGW
jgi:hypothetical protein